MKKASKAPAAPAARPKPANAARVATRRWSINNVLIIMIMGSVVLVMLYAVARVFFSALK